MVEVRKKGYLPYRVTVNDFAKAEMDMLVNLEPREDFLKYPKIDKNIAELFEAQRLLRAKQYDEAISVLKGVGEKEPFLSIIPEFIGSAYYLKKQNRKSLDFYKKAYRINPENRDAFVMKNYLEKALGVTKAASYNGIRIENDKKDSYSFHDTFTGGALSSGALIFLKLINQLNGKLSTYRSD